MFNYFKNKKIKHIYSSFDKDMDQNLDQTNSLFLFKIDPDYKHKYGFNYRAGKILLSDLECSKSLVLINKICKVIVIYNANQAYFCRKSNVIVIPPPAKFKSEFLTDQQKWKCVLMHEAAHAIGDLEQELNQMKQLKDIYTEKKERKYTRSVGYNFLFIYLLLSATLIGLFDNFFVSFLVFVGLFLLLVKTQIDFDNNDRYFKTKDYKNFRYAVEEVCVEICADVISRELGWIDKSSQDSQNYINHWCLQTKQPAEVVLNTAKKAAGLRLIKLRSTLEI